MGAACVRPIQHDQTKPFAGHQNAYQVQPQRNQRTPLNSGSGNQNLSLTQLEQQLKKQQQQQKQREQQQRQQREQQQREQQQQQQREQRQQEEQQEQLQLQQQLEQERQQQEQQQLQQQQPPQQFLPVTDAGSLNQTFEVSDNLKSTTDRVPATDCHNETQVDSPKEIKRCDSLIDDDNYCPTCFYGYETDNPKIPTKCHHHYHLSCILEWMERSPTCPVCSQVMIILPM